MESRKYKGRDDTCKFMHVGIYRLKAIFLLLTVWDNSRDSVYLTLIYDNWQCRDCE